MAGEIQQGADCAGLIRLGKGFGLYFKCNRRPLKTFKQRVWASLVAQMVKNLPVNLEDLRNAGLILRWEGPLEEGMATHSSILAWKIPWTEEPGGLWSMGSQRVGHD